MLHKAIGCVLLLLALSSAAVADEVPMLTGAGRAEHGTTLRGASPAGAPEPGSVELLCLCLVGAFAMRRTHRG